MKGLFRRKRIATASFAVAVGLVTAGVAFGAEIIFYHGSASLSPGGYYSTSNELYRLHNRACRDGNSGQMSVSYWSGGSRIHYSGSQWTNCPTIVALENDGTFRSRCTNEGTVSFPVVCQTTKP